MTADNRDKFSYVAGQYNQLVKFYNVEILCAEKINAMIELVPAVKNSRVSIGAFYRLLIPKILPAEIDKCIYLDSDTLVNLNINELWQIELGDKPLASVPEMLADSIGYKTFAAPRNYLINNGIVRYEDYFNSAVMMINLTYFRNAEELLMSGIKWRGEHPQCICFDQDILNYLFTKIYLRLPDKFDHFVYTERLLGKTHPERMIYHFAGSTMNLDTRDPFNRLYIKYFMKTPWFNEESIGQLYAGVQRLHVGLKNSMAKISAIVSGKTRSFFTFPQHVELVRNYFVVHDDEEIIFAENNDSLKKLIDAMKRSHGRKIFFILVPNFPLEILVQAGFVYGRDFLNGFEFLSEAHGLPLNSYELIKAM